MNLTLFDYTKEMTRITKGKNYNHNTIKLTIDCLDKLNNYNLENYISDVEKSGLESTWNNICQFVIDHKGKCSEFLSISSFGELYEIGLAIQDKKLKKKSGQYYTPDDVAFVMSEWFAKEDGYNVCDVACGTGKLIPTYLDLIGYDKARELIAEKRLFLYDFDNVALKICRTSIAIKDGLDIADSINDIFCDFLDPEIHLPNDCKVIANPPYAHLDELQPYWDVTEVLSTTKEFYSAFMEKIFTQAKSTVIITPFSFIGSSKFYTLRKVMCDIGSGSIISFDNVPGNIFCGRKHGIFNSNNANSVRAAITIFRRDSKAKGFRISPLIRFKNEQRAELLQCELLEKTLSSEYQVVTEKNREFKKIHASLFGVYNDWVNKSDYKIKDFIEKTESNYFIDIPNTCRYFTTGSSRKLKRTGSISINIKDTKVFNFLYCFINSSFTYWWWRIFDGGITYTASLFNNMPVPINLLNESDFRFFSDMASKMISEEGNYIVTKMNAGVAQENIKFPVKYRLQINERLLKILGHNPDDHIFDCVHENKFE